jgi:hypothetical protein
MDFPKALFIHETIGIAYLIGVWGACYKIRPLKRINKFL